MSTRTPTSIGTGRAALPARPALDWADALLAHLGLGRRLPLDGRLALGREADLGRVAAGAVRCASSRPGLATRSPPFDRSETRAGSPGDRGQASRAGTGLLAAVEEAAATPSGRLGFLQSAVIR